ncbi:alpha/beta hydrolase family protein [Mycobacterium barrassiae]|uniref:alpha/beta hydrolase family protein n=1 Tax=Mycobacterium barrassiae TaxID=319709 RepID=UPI002265D8F3|nr:alpha/beta fold hydrolase [Mycobacterium barrassiae]
METVEYAPGRNADVFGELTGGVVLMWHGAQTDARTSMRPLAQRVADSGPGVVVPDWNSQATDRGRADLLRSLQFARESSAEPDAMVLVGWSMGGLAAAAVTIHAARLKVRLKHTVCLAGAFMVADPISGEPLVAHLADVRDRVPFTLLHGVNDDVVPVAASRDFAATLRQHAWPVSVAELPADHASIAGASYDAVAGRYSAAVDLDALTTADDVASRIAAFT